MILGLQRFEVGRCDPHIHHTLPKGLDAGLPFNDLALGWEELPMLRV